MFYVVCTLQSPVVLVVYAVCSVCAGCLVVDRWSVHLYLFVSFEFGARFHATPQFIVWEGFTRAKFSGGCPPITDHFAYPA